MNYNIITIEREFASGGSEIGEKLAERLNIPCYEREILERASEKIGIPIDELKSLEESTTGSFLYSLYLLTSVTTSDGTGLTQTQKLAIAESEIIRNLAVKPCVIVGRCAAGILKEHDNVLRIFIHADYDTRIKRAIEVYHNDSKQVETILRRYDRKRSNYFKANAGMDWKDIDVYHMFINSGKLGIDSVVDVLYSLAT